MSGQRRAANGKDARQRTTSVPVGGSKVRNVKLVLLGDQGVGKSSIALRFVRGQFSEHVGPTIGAALLSQTVNISDVAMRLDIWDTAGQERFHCLAPMYYRGAHAAVIVYDITNTETFQRAMRWIKELQQKTDSQIVMILAGNKVDMADNRSVSRQEAQAFAEENNLVFMESSAKTGMRVGDIFMAVAQTLAQRSPKAAEPETKSIKVRQDSGKKREWICC